MAVIIDCPGCRWGNHDEHNPTYSVIPGLIGGQVCHCNGDCAERERIASAKFAEMWGLDALG